MGEDELLVRVCAVGVGIHDSYFLPTDGNSPIRSGWRPPVSSRRSAAQSAVGIGTYRQEYPKTDRSNGVIALPSFTAEALRRRLASMADHSLDALVFRSWEDVPLTTANVRRYVCKALGEAGDRGRHSAHGGGGTSASVREKAQLRWQRRVPLSRTCAFSSGRCRNPPSTERGRYLNVGPSWRQAMRLVRPRWREPLRPRSTVWPWRSGAVPRGRCSGRGRRCLRRPAPSGSCR